jgi:hypothetical protein
VNPQKLVGELIAYYRKKHYKRPSVHHASRKSHI